MVNNKFPPHVLQKEHWRLIKEDKKAWYFERKIERKREREEKKIVGSEDAEWRK